MKRIMGIAIMAGFVSGFPMIGHGQNHDFPILNSLGRYFGAGYTLGGYHSVADGRLHHQNTVQQSAVAYAVDHSLPRPALQPVVIHSPQAGSAPDNAAGMASRNCAQGVPIPPPIQFAPLPSPPQMHRQAPLPAPELPPAPAAPGQADDRNSQYRESLPALRDLAPPADDSQSSPSDRLLDQAAADLQLQWPTLNQSLPSLDFYRPSLPTRSLESTPPVPAREQPAPPATAPINRYQQAKESPQSSIR